jgi:hypothetical protein
VPLAPVLADRMLVPLGAATCAGGLLTSYALASLIAALARA